ncbi:hypothetical protein N7509_001200 [Penicillium cosmopolitanum]|uniref:Aminoglycoside phosphotransferase domain-containing protein n=1 Tax=Penicillium cosmopolitanum TaxID=1131564 RepID=A0A9X0BEY4_9EURO|nr:uncharacterized protein N7509_001200 [Penicillium cosmopolitanum]KAJ5414573.1 hypothetical protein N7509_001200 [Penicillium cosmopolitanum]
MTTHTDPARVASILLSQHDSSLISCKTIQRLWAGYGQICSVTARAGSEEAATHLHELCYGSDSNSNRKRNGFTKAKAGDTFQLILKLISPPKSSTTAGQADEGHLRKMFSYEVEQYFYRHIVPGLDGLGVAKCLASTSGSEPDQLTGCMAILMADLRSTYPVSGEKEERSFFGSGFWVVGVVGDGYILPPLEEYARRAKAVQKGENEKENANGNVWLNGGYTYLATRRTEYASLVEDDSSEWSGAFCEPFSKSPGSSSSSTAELAALCLTPQGRAMESLIHGDVKSENLFTSESGDDVAFFDFQSAGFFGYVCWEKFLLERYRASLLRDKEQDPGFYDWDLFVRHWETALVDWCRFQASWGFWGNTEWLEARVRFILDDEGWRGWLEKDIKNLKIQV